ncbi:hypothetical protein HK405_005964, partial [Cladochytrium tenue]
APPPQPGAFGLPQYAGYPPGAAPPPGVLPPHLAGYPVSEYAPDFGYEDPVLASHHNFLRERWLEAERMKEQSRGLGAGINANAAPSGAVPPQEKKASGKNAAKKKAADSSDEDSNSGSGTTSENSGGEAGSKAQDDDSDSSTGSESSSSRRRPREKKISAKELRGSDSESESSSSEASESDEVQKVSKSTKAAAKQASDKDFQPVPPMAAPPVNPYAGPNMWPQLPPGMPMPPRPPGMPGFPYPPPPGAMLPMAGLPGMMPYDPMTGMPLGGMGFLSHPGMPPGAGLPPQPAPFGMPIPPPGMSFPGAGMGQAPPAAAAAAAGAANAAGREFIGERRRPRNVRAANEVAEEAEVERREREAERKRRLRRRGVEVPDSDGDERDDAGSGSASASASLGPSSPASPAAPSGTTAALAPPSPRSKATGKAEKARGGGRGRRRRIVYAAYSDDEDEDEEDDGDGPAGRGSTRGGGGGQRRRDQDGDGGGEGEDDDDEEEEELIIVRRKKKGKDGRSGGRLTTFHCLSLSFPSSSSPPASPTDATAAAAAGPQGSVLSPRTATVGTTSSKRSSVAFKRQSTLIGPSPRFGGAPRWDPSDADYLDYLYDPTASSAASIVSITSPTSPRPSLPPVPSQQTLPGGLPSSSPSSGPLPVDTAAAAGASRGGTRLWRAPSTDQRGVLRDLRRLFAQQFARLREEIQFLSDRASRLELLGVSPQLPEVARLRALALSMGQRMPWRELSVACVGPPGVGKSALIARLAGRPGLVGGEETLQHVVLTHSKNAPLYSAMQVKPFSSASTGNPPHQAVEVVVVAHRLNNLEAVTLFDTVALAVSGTAPRNRGDAGLLRLTGVNVTDPVIVGFAVSADVNSIQASSQILGSSSTASSPGSHGLVPPPRRIHARLLPSHNAPSLARKAFSNYELSDIELIDVTICVVTPEDLATLGYDEAATIQSSLSKSIFPILVVNRMDELWEAMQVASDHASEEALADYKQWRANKAAMIERSTGISCKPFL